LTCHTNNIRDEDPKYNVTPHNYPKYSERKRHTKMPIQK